MRFELLRTGEITHIVRNDGLAIGRDCKFQHELVLRIGQTRSPQEMNVLSVGHATQEVHDSDGRLSREIQFCRMSNEHGLVFQYQRNRYGNLELLVSKQFQEAKRSPLPGPQRRDKNAAVEHNEHFRYGITFDTVAKSVQAV